MNVRNARSRSFPAMAAGLLGMAALAVAGLGINSAAANEAPALSVAPAQDAAQQVQQTLAHYVRDTDHRDGASLSKLFSPQGKVEIYAKNDKGAYDSVGSPIVGRDAIEYAVTHFQAPLPVLGSEHHVTADPVVTVKGATAHLNVQFITYAVQGTQKPAGGWPAGTAGAQGTIKPYETGYYDADLRRVGGAWQITDLRILHDLPIVIPGS
ncbi:nuclear transport factor 2 family protein [Streptomyces sp. NPDC087659]|uniref:nuclear transport factor 2 family protein n=1 Tax=Streptomyces sp. NPDC087659 TaxID=3365801 RepID=UPI00380A1667